MGTEAQSSPAMFWAGWVVTGLVVLFLAFDAVTKVLKVAPVVEATEKLGYSADAVRGIGLLLMVCTAVYAAPPTAVLGAVLLTAYLGGAVATHVRAGSGMFPIAFSAGFGALVWAGLILRDPRLLWVVLLRQ